MGSENDNKIIKFHPDKKKHSGGFYASIGSVALLVVVVVSFIAWPIMGRLNSGFSAVTFGRYKSQTIEYAPDSGLFFYWIRGYQSGIDSEAERLAAMLNPNPSDADIQRQLRPAIRTQWRKAFNNTVVFYGKKDKAVNDGFVVTDSEINKEVVSGFFTDENGEVNELAIQRASPIYLKDYQNTASYFLYGSKVAADYLSALTFSEEEEAFLKLPPGDLRKIHYTYFTLGDYPEESVVNFANENKQLFRQINLSRITVSSKNEAESVRNKIAEGTETFSALAEEFSIDPYSIFGGAMDWTYFYSFNTMVPNEENAEAVFALKSGEFSEIIEDDRGNFFIFYCNEEARDGSGGETFSEEVRQYLETYELGLLTDYLRAEAEGIVEVATESQSLQEVASEFDSKNDESAFFVLNVSPVGGNSHYFYQVVGENGFPEAPISNSEVWSLAVSSEPFYTTLYSLAEQEISEPILLGGRIIIVMQLIETKEATEEDFFDYSIYGFTGYATDFNELNTRFLDTADSLSYFASGNFVDNFDQGFSKIFPADYGIVTEETATASTNESSTDVSAEESATLPQTEAPIDSSAAVEEAVPEP